MGIGSSAFSLALNKYFQKNRAKASGIAYTVTGFGPILVPQFINWLMVLYSVDGAMLIVSAAALHSLVAAALLQPVEWHQKNSEEEMNIETEVIKGSGNNYYYFALEI